MRNITFFILIAIFLNGCSTSELDGIWMKAYTINGKSKFYSHGTTLFDFKSGSLQFVEIGNPDTGELDTVLITEYTYSIEDPIMTLISSDKDEAQIILETVANDSIQLRIPNQKEVMVLRRLVRPDGVRISKNDLSGKTFEIPNASFISKLDFANDSMVFDNDYSSKHRWTLSSYKEFDFLNTSIWMASKLPILKVNDRITVIVNKGRDLSELQEVKSIRDKSELFGNWIEVSRTAQSPLPFQVDTLQTIEINKDSLTIRQYNKKRSLLYRLNTEGTVLYFPDNKPFKEENWNLRTPMEILELTQNKLVVLKQFLGDSAIIEFKKSW